MSQSQLVDWECSVCGLKAIVLAGESVTHTCTQSIGLGDWTEQMLSSVGITKDRYKAAKELFGLAPTCGCDGKQAWLNKVSDWWRGVV